jgi:hypothetical protein
VSNEADRLPKIETLDLGFQRYVSSPSPLRA